MERKADSTQSWGAPALIEIRDEYPLEFFTHWILFVRKILYAELEPGVFRYVILRSRRVDYSFPVTRPTLFRSSTKNVIAFLNFPTFKMEGKGRLDR